MKEPLNITIFRTVDGWRLLVDGVLRGAYPSQEAAARAVLRLSTESTVEDV